MVDNQSLDEVHRNIVQEELIKAETRRPKAIAMVYMYQEDGGKDVYETCIVGHMDILAVTEKMLELDSEAELGEHTVGVH